MTRDEARRRALRDRHRLGVLHRVRGRVWVGVVVVVTRDPNNPAHWQPGDNLTIRTNADAFGIQTHAGMVYVAPH